MCRKDSRADFRCTCTESFTQRWTSAPRLAAVSVIWEERLAGRVWGGQAGHSRLRGWFERVPPITQVLVEQYPVHWFSAVAPSWPLCFPPRTRIGHSHVKCRKWRKLSNRWHHCIVAEMELNCWFPDVTSVLFYTICREGALHFLE